MKLKIILTNQFKKDLKRAKKRGRNLDLLDQTVTKLANQEPLPQSCRDHDLSGGWTGFRECHIQPDWLLIYRIDHTSLILILFRNGSHADLF